MKANVEGVCRLYYFQIGHFMSYINPVKNELNI